MRVTSKFKLKLREGGGYLGRTKSILYMPPNTPKWVAIDSSCLGRDHGGLRYAYEMVLVVLLRHFLISFSGPKSPYFLVFFLKEMYLSLDGLKCAMLNCDH